jgi:hypothetical protein
MALKVLCQASGLTEWKVVNSLFLSLLAGLKKLSPDEIIALVEEGWRDDPVNTTQACCANLVRRQRA